MAVIRQANLLGQQRLDVPHVRAIESAVAGDFDVLAGQMLSGEQSVILNGFRLSTSTTGGAATDLKLQVAGGAMMHFGASESGTMFSVPADRADEELTSTNAKVIGSFTANQTNYIGIDFRRAADSSTADLVQFIDPTTGKETSATVPLARTLDYRIYISTTNFDQTPNVCPVAKVVTNSNNNVTSITDARQMMFRLGAGGTTPSASYSYPWTQGRNETTAVDGWSGGDKNIGSLKQWQDAVMTRLWEIGGGEYWYANAADRNVTMIGNGTTFTNGEYFTWNSGTGQLQWQNLRFLFDNSTANYNIVKDSSAMSPTYLVLADGDCVYVDLDRSVNGATVTPVKGTLATMGNSAIPGNRYVMAWRNGSNVFTRGWRYAVGYTFTAASTTANGVVRLNNTPGNATNPVVPSIMSNGQIEVTATANAWYAIKGTGHTAGPGVYAVSGSGNGMALQAEGTVVSSVYNGYAYPYGVQVGASFATRYTRSFSPYYYVGRRVALGVYDYSSALQSYDEGVNPTPLTINPAGGNVGIGPTSTSPIELLHLSQGAANYGGLQITNTGAGGASFGLFATNSSNSLVPSSFGLYDSNGWAYRMVVDSSGNIGMGTLAPSSGARLHLAKAGQVALDLQNTITGGTPTGGAWWRIFADNKYGGAGDLTLGFFDVRRAAVAMGIDNYGRVGIGTNYPEARLHVNDYTSDAIHVGPTSGGYRLRIGTGNSNSWRIQNVDDNTGQGGTLSLQYSGGGVGIGTDSALGTLDAWTGPTWSSSNYGLNMLARGIGKHNSIGLLDSSLGNPWAMANVSGTLTFSTMPALGNTSTAATPRVEISNAGNVTVKNGSVIVSKSGEFVTATNVKANTIALWSTPGTASLYVDNTVTTLNVGTGAGDINIGTSVANAINIGSGGAGGIFLNDLTTINGIINVDPTITVSGAPTVHVHAYAPEFECLTGTYTPTLNLINLSAGTFAWTGVSGGVTQLYARVKVPIGCTITAAQACVRNNSGASQDFLFGAWRLDYTSSPTQNGGYTTNVFRTGASVSVSNAVNAQWITLSSWTPLAVSNDQVMTVLVNIPASNLCRFEAMRFACTQNYIGREV